MLRHTLSMGGGLGLGKLDMRKNRNQGREDMFICFRPKAVFVT